MSGVQAAVHIEEGKNQGRVGQTKVQRYWPGQAPAWADTEVEDDDNLMAAIKPAAKDDEEVQTTRIAAPVVLKKVEDPRLARLAQREVRAPEVSDVLTYILTARGSSVDRGVGGLVS
jgi:microfibrillar-associated protein 1